MLRLITMSMLLMAFTQSLLAKDYEEITAEQSITFNGELQDVSLRWQKRYKKQKLPQLTFTGARIKIENYHASDELDKEFFEYLEKRMNGLQVPFSQNFTSHSEMYDILMAHRRFFGLGTIGEVQASGEIILQKVSKVSPDGYVKNGFDKIIWSNNCHLSLYAFVPIPFSTNISSTRGDN